jgi:hypothetical protein
MNDIKDMINKRTLHQQQRPELIAQFTSLPQVLSNIIEVYCRYG